MDHHAVMVSNLQRKRVRGEASLGRPPTAAPTRGVCYVP